MKRAKHTLSHYRMHTGRMGELIPITCYPVLPGDTVQQSSDVVIRVTPLNTPVMHAVTVRTHHWYVPFRHLWPESENGGWEQFITGGPDGTNSASPPTLNIGDNKKAVTSYLGYSPTSTSSNTYVASAMALRGFWQIYNKRYRDQDIIPEVAESTNAGLPRIAWEKDYATVARPWAQKGPLVTLPIGQTAPVATATQTGDVRVNYQPSVGNTTAQIDLDSSAAKLTFGGTSTGPAMYADLTNASQLNINDFRTGFALQRYQEARSRYGSRFTEYLRYLGVTPSDARLQDPEFLGGGSARLQFSEVLQTTPATGENVPGVGDLYGHGIAGVRTNTFRKFFEEHGFVYTLLSVRPKAVYQNGIPREFLKTTKEDYFQKELASLGQQELYAQELAVDADKDRVMGFTDRYEEYRKGCSMVGQDFRDTLKSWHLARDLPSDVALNQDFIDCKPSDRIFQVGESVADPLWIFANHRVVARRMVPKRANPRVV